MTAPKTPKPVDGDAIQRMCGAWADRDDIDDGWLDRLRGSWDESLNAIYDYFEAPAADVDRTELAEMLKAIMRCYNFTAKDVERLTEQEAANDFLKSL